MKKIPQSNKQCKLNPLYELLRADGSIIANKALVHAIGLNEAILFAELISRSNYFADRNALTDDGYFFNTVLDLQTGTALTDYQQRRAIKNLEEMELLNTRLKDSPPKRYFKVADDIEIMGRYLQQGKAIMTQLEADRDKQKARIEGNRRDQEGYFDPKYLKSEETLDFKSEETLDSNLKKLQTNNTKVNNTKIERVQRDVTPAPSHSLTKGAVKETIAYLQELYRGRFGCEYPITNGKDHAIIRNLLEQHGHDTVREILKLHINTKDDWITERGCALTTIKNSLAEYLVTINKAVAAAERKKLNDEEHRRRMEADRLEDEELSRERAAYEALSELEKAQHDLIKYQENIKPLREIFQEAIEKGDTESGERLEKYELRERELLQRIDELQGLEAATG